MDRQSLTHTIKNVSHGYLSRGWVSTVREINAGFCHQFADDVLRVFEDTGKCADASDIGLGTVGIANFLTPTEKHDDFNDGFPFDRELLQRYWPTSTPPEGLDWDDLDRLSEDACFNVSTHSWVTFEGRHYDSECPEGVDSFWDLPFMARVVESWKAEGPQAPAQRALVATGP